MHSKVIIASLVCMLAANFGNGKIANLVKEVNQEANAQCVSSIPNQNVVKAFVSEDYIYSGNFFTATFNIYGSDELADTIEVITDTDYLYEEFFYYQNGQLAVRLYAPDDYGDNYISFGVGDEELVTIYTFTSNGYTSISTVSKHDARSKMFMNYELNYSERELLMSDGTGLTSQQKREKYQLEREYNDYVYYDSNDQYSGLYLTSGNGGNITIKVRMQWVDVYDFDHQVAGSDVGLFLNGNRINPSSSTTITGEDGYYTYTMTQSQASNYSLKDLGVQVAASNNAVKILDNSQVAYNCTYKNTRSEYIKSYSQIKIDMYMYSGFSDRANAFQIAQAQRVPCNYAQAMNRPVSSATTYYPCVETEYDWYDDVISIRKDHFDNWDVLNHEYGHYLSDQLNLCYYYGNGFEHNIDENLANRFNYTDAKKYAYAEGLATYIALASQMYSGINDVYGVGDYIYNDSQDGVYVNYNVPASGTNHNQISNQAIEKTVTSIMIKLMDNVSRSYDDIALGHQTMFSLMSAFPYFGEKDVNGLLYRVINYTSTSAQKVYALLNQEIYENKTFQYTSITTNSVVDNSWTIRFASSSAINLVSADYAKLTFTGVNGDTYTIQVSLPRTSYKLTSNEVQAVMNLSGAQASVKAVAYRDNGTIALNAGDIMKINKAGAVEVLSHWHSSVSMPSNRRYQWIVVRSVKNNSYTQQVILEGTGWSGQVAQVFDHIVPDSTTSSTKIYANSNGTVPTITKTLSYHQCMYIRVDMNARNQHYLSVQTYD